MNRFQANLCLLCATLCWSAEVLVYACIPDGVAGSATVCVTSLGGAALLLVPFGRRVAAGIRAGGRHLLLAGLALALLNVVYSLHFIAGLRVFKAAESAFVNCLGMVVMPIVLLAMRRRVAPETWLSVAVRRVPAENATAIGSLKLVFTLLLGVLLPAGLITRIELSPRVIVGAAFVVAGSLAQIVDFGAFRAKRAH